MKQTLLNIIYKLLKLFAKIYLFRTKPFVIGITGSVGKTSCRMIITKVLQTYINDKKIYTSSKNFNSEIGLVLSIFSIEEYKPGIFSLIKLLGQLFFRAFFQFKNYDIIVLEYGIDKPNDMIFLLSIIKPDISIFTKIDFIHAENFPDSKKGVLKEKMKLILNSKEKTYINCSDEDLNIEYKKINSKNIKKQAFYDIKKYKYILNKNNIVSEFLNENILFKTNMLGSENFTYIDLGFKILKDLGKDIKEKNIYIDFQNQSGRFSVLEGIKGNIIIDSTYNAGPESMKKMINNTFKIQKSLKKYLEYKVIFVLGGMRELGSISKKAHEQIGELLKKEKLVFTVGTQMKKYCSFKNFKNAEKLGKYLLDFLNKKDEKYIILFKGSQNTIFLEESVKQILKNKNDKNKLVRQEDYWMKIKKEYFNKN